jgi:hypothetical protein
MTIETHVIQELAPDVPAEARESRDKGWNNPFITLKDLEVLCKGDEDLEYFLRETTVMCLRYTETLCRFKQIVIRGQQSNEDGFRKEIEAIRTTIHDSTITSINVLSRLMKKTDRNNDWIKNVSVDRTKYAKFAMCIAFESVLGEEVK